MKGQLFAIANKKRQSSQLHGQGSKGILVVVANTEKNEQMLGALLNAIKLDMISDVYTLTLDSDDITNLSELIADKQITKMVSFGFDSSSLGFNLVHAYYHIYHLGSLSAIFSESISQLGADKSKKVALWKVLQELFL